MKQVIFLALFGLLCSVFVFFVPWGASPAESETPTLSEQPAWAETSESSSPEKPSLTGKLTLAISSEKVSPELKQFLQAFSKRHGVEVTLAEVIYEEDGQKFASGADLQLLAYDLFSGVAAQKILFQEDIRPLFIPQLQEFVGQHSDFIPFSLDPAVMYGWTGLKEGFDGLYAAFSAFRPRIQNASFGFGIADASVLYDQNLILAQQVQDFIQFNDVGAFQQWVEMNGTMPSLQQKLLTTMQTTSKLCLEEPLGCLLQKQLLGIGRGFASDFSPLLKKQLVSYANPYQYVGSPVRLYGFAVLPGANRALVDQFLLEYMDLAFQTSASFLGSGMIPVFQNQFSQFCGADACSLAQELVILENGPAKIEKFLNDKLLWKVIEKKVQPDLYLREASI